MMTRNTLKAFNSTDNKYYIRLRSVKDEVVESLSIR